MSARILIAVTHLLGIGHLVRARALAQALAGAGHSVTLASGGRPLPAAPAGDKPIRFVQLPPVCVRGTDFATLLDEDGRPVDEARRAARRARLATLARALAPDMVVTEHFPFGRRQLAEEYLGLIAAARQANPSVRVVASIRDVLVAPRRPERIAEAEARIASGFDAVLVHADPAFLLLEASWPVSPALAGRLRYTGYLGAAAPAEPASESSGTVLVSGGGSEAALPLFEGAVRAARLLPWRRWHLLAGTGVSEERLAGLAAAAPDNVRIERARPDFRALLAGCAATVSQAGYNTVLDLVAARRPAVLVPFDAGHETEQAVRAAALERAGLARLLRLEGSRLDPVSLARCVAEALAGPAPRAAAIDLGGAVGSVAAVEAILAGR